MAAFHRIGQAKWLPPFRLDDRVSGHRRSKTVRLYIPETRPADLTAKLAAERAQCAAFDGWVFSGREGETTRRHKVCFERGFRRAVIAAGLDDKIVAPHVMRHAALTRLVRAGADIPTISKTSGDKRVSMVLQYAHVDAVHIDAAASALEVNSGNASHPKFTVPTKAAAAVTS